MQPLHFPVAAPAKPRVSTLAVVFGVIALLFVAGGVALLVYALPALPVLDDLTKQAGKVPEWLHAQLFNDTLRRLRWFGIGAGLMAFFGVLASLPALRSVLGKIALGVGLLTLAGSVGAEVYSGRYEFLEENGPPSVADTRSALPGVHRCGTGNACVEWQNRETPYECKGSATPGRCDRTGLIGACRMEGTTPKPYLMFFPKVSGDQQVRLTAEIEAQKACTLGDWIPGSDHPGLEL
jgi:hypothetical protein